MREWLRACEERGELNSCKLLRMAVSGNSKV